MDQEESKDTNQQEDPYGDEGWGGDYGDENWEQEEAPKLIATTSMPDIIVTNPEKMAKIWQSLTQEQVI